jgi:Ca-activated chloride channel family protein
VPDVLSRIAGPLLDDWRALQFDQLQFWHKSEGRLLLLALLGVAGLLVFIALAFPRSGSRYRVAVPAVLASIPRHFSAGLTHIPLLVALAGLPFLAVAVADPYTALVRREATYPGRRICLMIDASNSMSSPFRTQVLKAHEAGNAFVTTVAAAERFVQMRMNGRYRDLLALVEFGSEAYVVTPFTNDYENLLVSLSLIGEPHEFAAFPEQQTLIGKGIEEAVALFRAFKYLDATGNLLLIFSDGEDTNATVHGRPLEDIISGAIDAGVPVYFVRTNYNKLENDPAVPDRLWSDAVRKTGGKFFAASDEASLLAAINEIDQVAAGTIQMTEYSTQRPRFTVFAALAALCFAVAAAAKLTVPWFQRFP